MNMYTHIYEHLIQTHMNMYTHMHIYRLRTEATAAVAVAVGGEGEMMIPIAARTRIDLGRSLLSLWRIHLGVRVAVCGSVLQYAAVCCSVLQCVLQYAAVCWNVMRMS